MMIGRDWEEVAIATLTATLCEDYNFPEINARRLARYMVDVSYPDFGDDDNG